MVPRVYDLVLTHALDTDDFFIHRIQRRCAEAGLNFFLLEPLWAAAFLEALENRTVIVRSMINLHSEHHDPKHLYSRLVATAEALGVRMIDPPSKAIPAFDKAAMHVRLLGSGIQVPPTVILDAKAVADWKPTEAERAMIGTPFVVKPSLGYGRRGVILDATEPTDLQRSLALWPDRTLLLQERIEPQLIEGEPAYFRVYFVAGRTWACWWNCFGDGYRELPKGSEEALGLSCLHEITRRLGEISGLKLFSTEICLAKDGKPVVIDYINDQIHLLTQSAHPGIGMPDRIVAEIVDALMDLVIGWSRESRVGSATR